MIYIVLGMHKSGTSLVSETLHHSGINMGESEDVDPGRSYDQGNKYERSEAFLLNNEILDSFDIESIQIPIPDQVEASEGTRARMGAMVDRLTGRHEDWGFKDPRTCLTYPAWAPLLPDHRIVAVYRSLHDLTERYGADRSLRRARALVRSWHEHNLRIISYLETPPTSCILLSYDRLMTGTEELERLERFIGRPVIDRRRRALKRGAPKRGLRMRTAEALYALSTGRRTGDTLDRLNELSAA